MNATKVLLLLLVSLIVGLVIVGGCVYSGYNKAVGLDEAVKSKWAQVENQLQRRFDLIPNLEATVKGVAGHEKDVFLGIAKARESYFQARKSASTSEKVRAASGFQSALSRLLMLRESYPQLKANTAFQDLMAQLEGTENRISVERKRYNEGVEELNTFTRKALGRFYAGLAGVGKAEYFEIEEAARAAPKVSFTDTPAPADSP
ncbi:MAG: LemA family protein [Planctomycetota bacterium]|jgi:LemA protein